MGSPERDYQRTLVASLEAIGYRVNWTRPVFDARAKRWLTPTTATGWPDLTAVGVAPRVEGAVLAIEVKSDRGTLATVQRDWLRWWHAVPSAAAMLLRPRDPWAATIAMFQYPHDQAVSGYGWLPPELHRTGLARA